MGYQSSLSGAEINNIIKQANNILSYVYPIGSIYMSVNNTSPAVLFGGSWTQLENRFLFAADSTYTAGSIGGESTHTLTTDEMPTHVGHLPGSDFFQGYGNATSKLLHENTMSTVSTTGKGWDKDGSEMYPHRESRGGSQPHNNMPPYLTVYMWERIK